MIAGLVVVVVGAFGALLGRRLERVEVTGNSMLPTLAAGDRLLVWRTGRIDPGDVVVVLDPRDRSSRWVKRVGSVDDRGVDVRGDRPEESTDSRHVGAIPHDLVVGRVIRRYDRANLRGAQRPSR